MKLALFFFLSCAVHGAAILIPISVNGRATHRPIVVAVLPLESADELNGGGAAPVGGPRAGATKSITTASRDRTSVGAPPSLSVSPETPMVEAPSVAADKSITTIAAVALTSFSNSSGEIAGAATGGNHFTGGRFGAGSAGGSGDGGATGPGGGNLIQARYRETPQPDYPDSARRAGKEGRVLLRVLVDAEGRAKAVEVNSSSGHDMLDQAATDALKKWRFVPARAGDKPVETWVKVPIEFQLSHAKP